MNANKSEVEKWILSGPSHLIRVHLRPFAVRLILPEPRTLTPHPLGAVARRRRFMMARPKPSSGTGST
jgi:hypothetical protein